VGDFWGKNRGGKKNRKKVIGKGNVEGKPGVNKKTVLRMEKAHLSEVGSE